MPIVRLSESAPVRYAMTQLLESLESDAETLDEAKKKGGGSKKKAVAKSHHPFKRKADLGPGPRHGTNKKKNVWQCKCSSYTCQCKNIKTGRKKTVRIDPGYKADYNKEYRTWRADKYK